MVSSTSLPSTSARALLNDNNTVSSSSEPKQQVHQQEPLLKKRKLQQTSADSSIQRQDDIKKFAPVNNFEFINVNIANIDEEEDFLSNLNESNSNNLEFSNNNLDEDLRQTELRISELFQQQASQSPLSSPTSSVSEPVFSTQPPTTTTTTTTTTTVTSLEEFLNYDLMPSLTEESDLESTTSSSSSSVSSPLPNSSSSSRKSSSAAATSSADYLPQCFDYRSNHDSVNLSLIQSKDLMKNGGVTQRKFINAIKKRGADVFLTDGMFNQFF